VVAVPRIPHLDLVARHLARHPVLRDALAAWLGQRLLLLALVWLVQRFTSRPSLASLYRVWTLWDAGHYAQIAATGYRDHSQAAFYPLFPLIARALAPLVGGDPALAGILIANAACLAAFALLRLLVEQDLGPAVARRTLLYLALFPTGMFFAAGYTESLFLLLAIGAFLALRARRWLVAGLLAALATLTRATGLVLALPIAVAAFEAYRLRWARLSGLRGWERLRASTALGAALLPLAAYIGFQLMLDATFGLPGAQQRAEAQFWGRQPDWPWVGIIRSIALFVSGYPSVVATDLLFAVLWLVIAVSMVWPSARPLPRAYVVYVWGALALALIMPVRGGSDVVSPLTSLPRYMLVAFPCCVRLAQWSLDSRWAHGALVAASLCGMIASLWLFAQGGFIA
jgi:hypothetical protein